MSKMRKEARKKMLQEMKKKMKETMSEGMKDKMENMQKVTVASETPEGLKEGLSKAQEILEKRKDMMGDDYACGGKKDEKKKRK